MGKMIDKETFIGWKRAAATSEIDARIHPAGFVKEDYDASGRLDAERVMKYVKPTDYVMDYGCGNGRVLKHIPNRKIGIDAVPQLAQAAGGLTPDMFHDKVDVVYSISVFIHNSYESGANIIRWLYDHVNEGGLLLLQIPIYEVAKDPGNWIDVGVWTEKMFMDAVEGFKVVELKTNPGAFTFERIGANHHEFQILRR
jgi:SAM-dependent methyltransferase